MTNRRLALSLIACAFSQAPRAVAADSNATQLMHISSTQQEPFRTGGTIYVNHSFGELWIEGWDRPDVEIVVTKSPDELYAAKDQAAANKLADNVKVTTSRKSDSELVIATTVGHFSRWRHPFSEVGDVMMQCRIRVPRDSKLVIHHEDGEVLVSNMTGDIDATGRTGDIVVLLPDNGKYAIDAISHIGTLSSDFDGHFHRSLWSSDFRLDGPDPAHHVRLREGLGGIEIKSSPVVAQIAAKMQ